MAEKRYLRGLSPDDRLRYYSRTERSKLVAFTVQYETAIGGEWHPVVRYDTAHGFAHRDLMHPDGTQDKTRLPIAEFKMALQYALSDLTTNWEIYKEAYLKELSQ